MRACRLKECVVCLYTCSTHIDNTYLVPNVPSDNMNLLSLSYTGKDRVEYPVHECACIDTINLYNNL